MQLLQHRGHSVRWVQCPKQALVVSADFRPDVAIVDIGLPVMSGYELVAALSAMNELAGCRYFAVTGFAGAEVAQKSFAAGFEQHLTKPIQFDELLARLRGNAGRGSSPEV